MNIEILRKQTATRQVKMITMNILYDGEIHSRKEILKAAIDISNEYNLKNYTPGVLASGFEQAINELNCKKLSPGLYRCYEKKEINKHSNMTISQRAEKICYDALNDLSILGSEIIYVEADEKDIQILQAIRDCAKEIEKWKKTFKEESYNEQNVE